MRSPVRIRVAAPDNPEAIASGLWFFIGFCGTSVGVLFLFGVIGSCYSRFGTRSVTCHGIRFAYPARRSTSSLVRRRAWVSSPSANTRGSSRFLAAAPVKAVRDRTAGSESPPDCHSLPKCHSVTYIHTPRGSEVLAHLLFFVFLLSFRHFRLRPNAPAPFLRICFMFLFFLVVI